MAYVPPPASLTIVVSKVPPGRRSTVMFSTQATSRPVPYKTAPRREGDPARLVADPAKARRILDWRAVTSDLDVILSSAWAWHCKDKAARNAGKPGKA